MNEQEIKAITKKGEGHYIEFKREDENNKDFAKTIVSFANADGGKILIGVGDNGEIIGVSDVDKLMRRIDDISLNLCSPPITVLQESVIVDNRQIVIVYVPKGIQRPYETGGITYIRSSNRIRSASREEKLRLFQASEAIFYDEVPVSKTTTNDLDFQEFEYFLDKYLDLKVNNSEELIYYLKNFHLIDEQKIPTVTGILFFGREPQRFLYNARVVCAGINGTDIAIEPFDKKDVQGTIPDIIQQCESFLKVHLLIKHTVKNFEQEVKEELPFSALREILINAIAHRDYTINAPIRLLIFTDRLEVHSPGVLPNTVTIDSIKVGGSHVLRNPTIYNLLVKMKMVTDLGSGVRRCIKLIKGHTGEEPEFEQTENEFIVRIKRTRPI